MQVDVDNAVKQYEPASVGPYFAYMANSGVAVRVMSVNEVVVNRIRTIRRRRGMSAQRLAERCQDLGSEGMSVHVLRHVEAARQALSVDQLFVIAAALDVAPIELLNADGEVDACVGITSKLRIDGDTLPQWVNGLEIPPSSTASSDEEVPDSEDRRPVDEAWAKSMRERSLQVFGSGSRHTAGDFDGEFRLLIRVLRISAQTEGSIDDVLAVLDRFEKRLGTDTASGEDDADSLS